MQGQPLSITDSQSKDERFSKLLMSNIRTMCFYLLKKTGKTRRDRSIYSNVLWKEIFAAHYLLFLLNFQ